MKHSKFIIPSNLLAAHGQTDALIALSAATRLGWMPRRNGQPIHVATLYRWDTRGVKGVRLQTVMVGRTRCTTEQALREFFKALAETDMRQMAPVPRPANSRERERAAVKARQILKPSVRSKTNSANRTDLEVP